VRQGAHKMVDIGHLGGRDHGVIAGIEIKFLNATP
jgi:hypothetical protein